MGDLTKEKAARYKEMMQTEEGRQELEKNLHEMRDKYGEQEPKAELLKKLEKVVREFLLLIAHHFIAEK